MLHPALSCTCRSLVGLHHVTSEADFLICLRIACWRNCLFFEVTKTYVQYANLTVDAGRFATAKEQLS
jgi:hypothetical protein